MVVGWAIGSAWRTVARSRSQLAGHTPIKGEHMRETGILSIVKRGPAYQVRYASCNPYDTDRQLYPRPDEGALVALLHDFGINGWSLQQAVVALRRGEVAVLPVTLSEAQLQAYFPPQHSTHVRRDAGDSGGQADRPRVAEPIRDMRRTRAKVWDITSGRGCMSDG
jgi:hypothetical protein